MLLGVTGDALARRRPAPRASPAARASRSRGHVEGPRSSACRTTRTSVPS
jgi:hypothetical protein